MHYKRYKIVVILSLISCLLFTNIAFGNINTPEKSKGLFNLLISQNKLEKMNNNGPIETVLSDNKDVSSPIGNNKTKLSEYGFTEDEIKSSKTIYDNANNRKLKRVEYNNKKSISFDDKNRLVSIVNFEDKKSKGTATSISDLIEKVKSGENLGDAYIMASSKAFDDDYWEVTLEKKITNTLNNPFDSIKIFINRNNNTIVSYNRFTMEPNATQPQISANEALTFAKPIIDKFSKSQYTTEIKLLIVRPNFFWNEGGPYKQIDSARLAYEILVDNSYKVYIDAITGENLGGDIIKTNDAKAFAFSGFENSQASAIVAHDSLALMGYNTLPSLVTNDGSLGSSLYTYIHSPSSYALYVDCHGSPTVLTDDNSTWTLAPSEVTGNWHFVFLDACNTATTTGWADAFRINGYTNRAFLGWTNTVSVSNAYSFCLTFWTEVVYGTHASNVKDSAVYAAASVPGSGTTPIRFYGDSTYNGRPY